jgi:uncharacterized protein YqgQ
MGLFGQLFGQDREKVVPELLPAIERAVSAVEPRLMQTSGYPGSYRKPVSTALEYSRNLAASIPGPVAVNRKSYARDALVHALFPSVDFVVEALCTSCALQDYHREFPATDELYALMGMRRYEKTMMGMELSGEMIQRDVVQKAVYFTSHTIEDPAPSEEQARDSAAWSFFDCLARKVKKRIEARKQDKQSLLQEKDVLMARLRSTDAGGRPALEEELSRMMAALQTTTRSLELHNYLEDFEAVLLNPGQHLRLDRVPIVLDSMGIRRENGDADREEAVVFNELIGFDRRNWTVAMVHCSNMQSESFSTRLDKAYRRLAI